MVERKFCFIPSSGHLAKHFVAEWLKWFQAVLVADKITMIHQDCLQSELKKRNHDRGLAQRKV